VDFDIISNISVTAESSWEEKIYLTFDIDWASDDVLEYAIDLIEAAGVAATWFITHETALLSRLRKNPKFQLGIHPNFNRLFFSKDNINGNTPEEIIFNLLKIVPEAKAVRSHSVTQSSLLLELFKKFGLTHDCNHFIPHQAGMELKPWLFWNGLIKVPYFWEDHVYLMSGTKEHVADLATRRGLRVFDFHPIHLALNTNDLKTYETSRVDHKEWHKLQRFVNQEKGVRTLLEELVSGSNMYG
jgi:hypothetical protein